MFCADRQNLLKWGDPITDFDYYAKKHGPMPAAVYDGCCLSIIEKAVISLIF